MKIILIGFMGAGKTSVGKVLAKKLNWPVVEMDEIILKISKRKSIREIFDKDGESHFRSLETKVCQVISKKDRLVVSTGGGVVGSKKNIDNLKINARVIYLKTLFSTIVNRLKNDQERPLFKDRATAERLFNLRQKLYEQAADETVATDNMTIEEIVNSLINLL